MTANTFEIVRFVHCVSIVIISYRAGIGLQNNCNDEATRLFTY